MHKIQIYLNTLLKLSFNDSQKRFYKFIFEKGVEYNKFEDAIKVKRLSVINSAKIKECYKNSLILSLTTDVDYIEGYYSFDNIPFPLEHAWNLRDGNIIDTTMALTNNYPVQYFGVPVPKDVLQKYVDSSIDNTHYTLLQYYFTLFDDKK